MCSFPRRPSWKKGKIVNNSDAGRPQDHLVDLRRLSQFVAVVDAGSLTEAASGLGVTQQALSAAIRTLEEHVGVQLFTRSKGMVPSEAGIRLYDAAQVLIAGADHALATARAVGSGKTEVLRAGYTPSISSVQVLDLLAPRLPADASLHCVKLFPRQMRAALLSGEIAIALRRGVRPPEGFEGAVVDFDRLNIAFRTEEAPDRPCIDLTDLKQHRLILWAPENRSRYSTYLLAQCRRSGFEPTVEISRFQGVDPISAPLTTTGAFALVAENPGNYLDGRIQVLPVRDPITVPIQAVWLPTTQTGLIGATVQRLLTASPGRPA